MVSGGKEREGVLTAGSVTCLKGGGGEIKGRER